MRKIESRDNPYLKHLAKLIEDSSYREETQKVVIQDEMVIKELLPNLKQGTVISKERILGPNIDWIEISEAAAKKLSKYSTVFAELPLPKLAFPKNCEHILALDRVLDPGNMGTLIRTAAGLKWDGLFLLPGCCDPFNDKALRASKGAIFKLPFLRGSWEDLDHLAQSHKMKVLGADLKGEPPEAFQKERCLLILGHEGKGLSQEALKRSQKVTIPLSDAIESLNVSSAGSILMYVLRSL